MEFAVDIRRIFRRIFSKLWLVVLITLIAASVGVSLTLQRQPNIYSAKATLVGAGNDASSIYSSSQILKNYAVMVQSLSISNIVVSNLPTYHLNAASVQHMLTASFVTTDSGSGMLYITASSADPKLSIAVANAAATAFTVELKNVAGFELAAIIAEATTATKSFDGMFNQLKVRCEFGAGGLFLICLIITLRETFSKTVTELEDCTLGGTIELLGVIPQHNIR